MKMKRRWIHCVPAMLLVIPIVTEAATVSLVTGDSLGTTSMNSAGNWDNTSVPSAGNDYEVSVKWLRTPTSGDLVFAGDTLSLLSGGAMLNKNVGTQTITADLILDGGYVRSGAGGGIFSRWPGT